MEWHKLPGQKRHRKKCIYVKKKIKTSMFLAVALVGVFFFKQLHWKLWPETAGK